MRNSWNNDFLEAYKPVRKFKIICLSKLHLDFSVVSDNENLSIKYQDPVTDDDPVEVKGGGVWTNIDKSFLLNACDSLIVF